MKRRGLSLSLMVTALMIAGNSCVSEDEPSIHLVTEYQLRGLIGGAKDARSIDNLDGLGGYKISCELGAKATDVDIKATTESLTFAIKSKAGGTCTFTVEEDNVYERECEIEKTESIDCEGDTYESPCRIAIAEQTGNMVQGQVCCKAIPRRGNNPKEGDFSVFAPGSGDKSADFIAYNCDGK
jgi:hypothetical protein